MMKFKQGAGWALVVGLTLVMEAFSQAPKTGVIVPGLGVATVKLGSPLSSFAAVFPKTSDADEDMPDSGCGVGSYHWVDIDLGATGVYAYVKDDAIFQLSVHTPRFALPNGIKVEVPEAQVKRTYPGGREYVLIHSGSAVVGGQDLVYWVDKDAGVAFELYWNQRKKSRSVNGIDIFPKGSDYRPEGCISTPQRWQQQKHTSR